MWNQMNVSEEAQVLLSTLPGRQASRLAALLSAAGIECRLVPAGPGDEAAVLVEETDAELAELVLAKRKKDVEEEEDLDDEEEEEDDDLEEDEDDEDDDFDDEDEEDEFEEEFEDDELDDDEEDIFYDDEDDE